MGCGPARLPGFIPDSGFRSPETSRTPGPQDSRGGAAACARLDSNGHVKGARGGQNVTQVTRAHSDPCSGSFLSAHHAGACCPWGAGLDGGLCAQGVGGEQVCVRSLRLSPTAHPQVQQGSPRREGRKECPPSRSPGPRLWSGLRAVSCRHDSIICPPQRCCAPHPTRARRQCTSQPPNYLPSSQWEVVCCC